MPGRILSMQRQARELGRLRTGYTDGARPVRSNTWIVSSHAEHYVHTAAQAWGGQVEKWQPQGGGAAQWRVRTDVDALDAILPPGDPLSQTLELWSGGGCQRRCDGVTELLGDVPCVCRARFGDTYHERPKGEVCATTSRLNVFLPDMPDVGVWRMETHSHYAASEIAGAVDLIKSAVGPDSVIPIRLRIEQRQRKAGGQTKKFPVVVMELRGITTGQVLNGSPLGQLPGVPRQVEAAEAKAITGPVTVDAGNISAALDRIAAEGTIEDLRAAWPQAKAAGMEAVAVEIAATFTERAKRTEQAPPAPSGESADDLWMRIMQAVPEDWPTSRVEDEFARFAGVSLDAATATHMARYLEHITAVAS